MVGTVAGLCGWFPDERRASPERGRREHRKKGDYVCKTTSGAEVAQASL